MPNMCRKFQNVAAVVLRNLWQKFNVWVIVEKERTNKGNDKHGLADTFLHETASHT